jgi:hypothetical protein
MRELLGWVEQSIAYVAALAGVAVLSFLAMRLFA